MFPSRRHRSACPPHGAVRPLALVAFLAVVIIGLAWRTGKAVIAGEICRPE